MPHVDADRNLLFGLLPLRNNFIDRDGLLDAFSRSESFKPCTTTSYGDRS
jgi:hypothetical protein